MFFFARTLDGLLEIVEELLRRQLVNANSVSQGIKKCHVTTDAVQFISQKYGNGLWPAIKDICDDQVGGDKSLVSFVVIHDHRIFVYL